MQNDFTDLGWSQCQIGVQPCRTKVARSSLGCQHEECLMLLEREFHKFVCKGFEHVPNDPER